MIIIGVGVGTRGGGGAATITPLDIESGKIRSLNTIAWNLCLKCRYTDIV